VPDDSPHAPEPSGATELFEESAEDLYEHAPCGYLSAPPGLPIVRVNQTFLTWTGYRREDLVGRKLFRDLLTAGGRIFHETHYAPLLQMQGWVREIAVDLVCADGSRLPALINSVVSRDAAGRPHLIRTTVFNATDRKEYERELVRERQRAERATQAKSDLISMISHEIRTPLSAIMGVASLLGMTDLSPKQEKLIRILSSSSEGLLSLVNDILDFSKIEAGKMALEARSLDLRELVSGIVQNLHVKAEEKGIALDAEIDSAVPAGLLGDPIKIGQVLTNLVGNAIKFTARGRVAVSLAVPETGRKAETEADAVAITFAVQDTGIGIAADRLPHIFDQFTQANYDIGLKYGGTGLGLSISKTLVELHGSEIQVESELGRGTTFSFTLRLKKAPAELAKRLEPVEPQEIRGLQVLVADDNEVNLFVLTGLLRTWGALFDVVSNGRLAVEHVERKDYDVVLMDLRMPELDGYAATRQIRALPDPKFARLPILALSASTRMGHQDKLDAAGFTEFVGKPINSEILFAKLARYVPRKA
jgi:PAS domain S-box-containing protein